MARQLHCILTVNFSPWSAYSGGGQRSTHNLASALARRGHRVSVVYTKPPWENVTLPPSLPYRVAWAALPATRSRSGALLRPLTAISVARRVAELLEAEGPAVVHGNGEESSLVPNLRSTRQFGFVVTPRYPSFPRAMEDGNWRRSRFGRLQVALKYAKYGLLGRALRAADVWCPTSAHAATSTARALGLDLSRMRVVHNGVSDEFLTGDAPRLYEPTAAVTTGVFFGRMAREKGVHTLVDALGRARNHVSEFVFIGRGPESAAVRARLEELGLDKRVRVEPWLDSGSLVRTVRRAAFAVLPSFEESFGNTMAEAMALGIPVISTTAGSIPEVVLNGRTGTLVPPGDAVALAEAMMQLAGDPGLARALGQAGRERVQNHFTWDAAAAKFEEHYETLAC